MSEIFNLLISTFKSTILDVIPVAVILFGFQLVILKQKIPNIKSVIFGFLYVIIGLSLFLVGLDMALFPLGQSMAQQLTTSEFLFGSPSMPELVSWSDYYWVYIFAFTIGFSTAIAEPSLLAVAIKANIVSGGTIGVTGLRVTVALGVAFGICLGSFRIITGIPIHYFIGVGYFIVIVQTFFAPKSIVPLAYDSGGVSTSTVTVPLVAALGLGLASNIPGRSALVDGFGMIAFACLFPMITVMGYSQISLILAKLKKYKKSVAIKS